MFSRKILGWLNNFAREKQKRDFLIGGNYKELE
jgi:hypothetical protein